MNKSHRLSGKIILIKYNNLKIIIISNNHNKLSYQILLCFVTFSVVILTSIRKHKFSLESREVVFPFKMLNINLQVYLVIFPCSRTRIANVLQCLQSLPSHT